MRNRTVCGYLDAASHLLLAWTGGFSEATCNVLPSCARVVSAAFARADEIGQHFTIQARRRRLLDGSHCWHRNTRQRGAGRNNVTPQQMPQRNIKKFVFFWALALAILQSEKKNNNNIQLRARKAFRSFLWNVMISSALSTQSAGVFLAADDDRCHLAVRGGGNVTSGHVVGRDDWRLWRSEKDVHFVMWQLLYVWNALALIAGPLGGERGTRLMGCRDGVGKGGGRAMTERVGVGGRGKKKKNECGNNS